MIKSIYHGTVLKYANDIVKNGIDLTIGRKRLDFGQGFYTTEDKIQAKEWAKRKAFGKDTPVVVCFDAIFDNLTVKKFLFQNNEWKNYVYGNRIFDADLLKDYDCIIGPMADGNIKQLIYKMRVGEITKRDFLNEISRGIGEQIAFKTEKSLFNLTYKGILEV